VRCVLYGDEYENCYTWAI